MEAELVDRLPEANGWQYEPKWDGFRGILENLDGELHLWSRNARPLLRYFPELAPLGERLPPRSALDGEIVIEREGGLDFDALQMRLHPAESRIRRLAAEIPAGFVVFDVLLWQGKELHSAPLEKRRAKVETLPFDVSPASRDPDQAGEWLERLEVAGFDGVIAKRLELPYLPGSREAVLKVKAHKTADCIVVGVRWKEKGGQIATLLLGLYDEDGELRYVGAASGAARGRRAEIEERVLPLLGPAPLKEPPGQPSRWRPKQELEWTSVRPELVVEVRFDKWQGARFRHGTRFLRFRPDKEPRDCTFAQVRPRPQAGDPTVPGLLAQASRSDP
jgi:ATP-dependent DNA ligase